MRYGFYGIAAAAIACTLIALFASGSESDDWEQRVATGQAFAARQMEIADSLRVVADSAETRARAYQATADSLRAHRTAIRTRVDSVPVPIEAQPYTAPRDTLIAILTQENVTLRDAITEQRSATDALRVANTRLTVAVDSLNAVLDARPKPRNRFIPQLGISVFVGMCQSGPCYGVGPSLSWRL